MHIFHPDMDLNPKKKCLHFRILHGVGCAWETDNGNFVLQPAAYGPKLTLIIAACQICQLHEYKNISPCNRLLQSAFFISPLLLYLSFFFVRRKNCCSPKRYVIVPLAGLPFPLSNTRFSAPAQLKTNTQAIAQEYFSIPCNSWSCQSSARIPIVLFGKKDNSFFFPINDDSLFVRTGPMS
jgi:hypothetical protein